MPIGLRPLFAVLVPALVVSCGGDNAGPLPASPDGYPFAYASDGCGPTDGPATRLYLTADTTSTLPTELPRLEVTIFLRAAELQGRSFSWNASSPEGWAGRCDGTCEEATSTSVTFRDNTVDTVLSGTVRLRFADGTSKSGGFEAAWKRTGLLCG